MERHHPIYCSLWHSNDQVDLTSKTSWKSNLWGEPELVHEGGAVDLIYHKIGITHNISQTRETTK